jgi:hypothetical protein
VFGHHATNADVYKILLSPLMEHYVSGYNVCLIVMGETDSGRAYSLMGDNAKPGLIQYAMDDIFRRIAPS